MAVRSIKYFTEDVDLDEFMKDLPEVFKREGTVIKDDRNEIRVINVGGRELCVKAFNKITLFNRLMYSWVRASKAKRSYKIAKLLLEKGIKTPMPIGYVEVKGACGILKQSFYISSWEPGEYIMSDVIEKESDEARAILMAFGRFMATKMHPAGFWHEDLSPGNILITKNSNHSYTFSIIDLNRIRKKKYISPRIGIGNLKKLTNQPIPLSIMAESYALASGNNPARFAFLLIAWQMFSSTLRRFVKRFLHTFKPKSSKK